MNTPFIYETLAISRDEVDRALGRAVSQLEALLAAEHIDTGAVIDDQLATIYAPLAVWLAHRRREQAAAPLVFGIAGAQGTGKTTLALLLAALLEHGLGLAVARFSLDDLYKTRAERRQLARDVHPLFITRGVPGTHDVTLGLQLLDRLRALPRGEELQLPRFDKARDDRARENLAPPVRGPIDVVLFEGWCLGARPETETELTPPVNTLERDHDPDGRFRRLVNGELAGAYQTLFANIDALLFLAAPDFDAVRRFRAEQEQKLEACSESGAPKSMDAAALDHFVQHFERITRRMLAEPPARAELVLRLDRARRVSRLEMRH